MSDSNVRLTNLERRVSRLRSVSAIAVAALVMTVTLAFTSRGTEPAGTDRLEIVDGSGTVRIRLSVVAGDGGVEQPALEFFDADSRRVATVYGIDGGATIELAGSGGGGDGKVSAGSAVELGADSDGAWMSLVDSGVPRIDARTGRKEPAISMTNGAARLKLGARPGFLGVDGLDMGLFLEDASTRVRGKFVVPADGSATMKILDEKGAELEVIGGDQ